MPAALLEVPRVNESEGVGIGQKVHSFPTTEDI